MTRSCLIHALLPPTEPSWSCARLEVSKQLSKRAKTSCVRSYYGQKGMLKVLVVANYVCGSGLAASGATHIFVSSAVTTNCKKQIQTGPHPSSGGGASPTSIFPSICACTVARISTKTHSDADALCLVAGTAVIVVAVVSASTTCTWTPSTATEAVTTTTSNMDQPSAGRVAPNKNSKDV
jgi:hypothetical protein